jgi:hypothetical protein
MPTTTSSLGAGHRADIRKRPPKANLLDGLANHQGTVHMSRTRGPSSGAGIPAPVYTVSEEARNGWEFYLHALNAVCCPAIGIDQLGFVLSANTAMDPVFDEDIRIKNNV